MIDARALARAARAFVAFWTLFFAIFAPVLVTHRFIGDPVDQLIEALPAYLGSHPLWEPRTMLGYPLAANPVEAHFYPLALAHLIPGSFDYYEVAAYVLAACGTLGLVRSTTGSTTGGVAAAFVFALGGFMIAQAGHLAIVEPTAWVPFLFWALTELRVSARAARASLAFSATLALALLAGQPQTIAYALFFALPYALVVARRADDGPRAYLLRAGVAFALGLGGAGIALLPATELLGASSRATLGFERFQEFTVPVLQQPLRLLFPYALGASALPPYEHSAIDVGSFAEMSDYAGIGGIALAVLAIRRARREPFAAYWIAAAAMALILASGNQLGLAWLTYRIPIYDLFRAPGRIESIADLAIAVLAGMGIAAVEAGRASVTDVRRAFSTVAVAMVLSLGLFAVLAGLPPAVARIAVSGAAPLDANPFGNAALGIPFVTLAVTAAAATIWAGRPASSFRRVALLGVILADMLGFSWFAYWRSAAFGHERLNPPPYAAYVRARLATLHQRVLSVPLPGVDDGGIGPNLNLLWDVPSLRGYTQLQLARTRAFFDSDWDTPVWPHAAASDPTLDLAAVRYVVIVDPPDPGIVRPSPGPLDLFMRQGVRWRLVEQTGDIDLLENERALPRAWIVRDAVPSDAERARRALAEAGFDPRSVAYVEGLDARVSDPDAARDSATVLALEPERMRVRVRCAARCFAITSDTTYPGWEALVDGRPTPLHPADAALRGVVVPKGAHDIEFRYVPRIYFAGALVSGASVVLAVSFGVVLARRRRATPSPR